MSMALPLRVVLTIFIWYVVYVMTFWLPYSVLVPEDQPGLASACAQVTGAAAAYGVWRWSGRAGRGLAASVFYRAIVVGAVGFAAGFFGPLLLTPDANQGPLLGIFITGPLGVVVGALWGAARWAMSRRANQTADPSAYR
jgi:hypothetical protein